MSVPVAERRVGDAPHPMDAAAWARAMDGTRRWRVRHLVEAGDGDA